MTRAALEPLTLVFREPSQPQTLYLDRDGILNEAVLRGAEISSPRVVEEIRLADDIDALVPLAACWNLVVVTNQPDLTRGTITTAFLDGLHARFNARVPLTAAMICPHLHADGCSCRKPAPGLLETYRRRFPAAARREVFVGDGPKDRLCAEAAGVPFILRRRPYNDDQLPHAPVVIATLRELDAALARVQNAKP